MSTAYDTTYFQHSSYTIRKKVFRLFGAGFQIYGPDGEVALYSEQKSFRLKEDIRIYADQEQRREVLLIAARSWLDFAAAYDVTDPASGELIGTFRRRGFSSLVRDQWELADASGRDIGTIQEDSAFMALARRFLPFADFIPQSFTMTMDGMVVCELRQHFNPIVQRMTVDFSPDSSGLLDKRLGLAAGILLSAIEGRQDGGLLDGI
jgi:uncharacterized protein YxjI